MSRSTWYNFIELIVTSWCSNPGPLKAFRRVDGFRELEETAKVCLSQVTTFPSFLHAVQSLVHACNVICMHATLFTCMQSYLHACNVICMHATLSCGYSYQWIQWHIRLSTLWHSKSPLRENVIFVTWLSSISWHYLKSKRISDLWEFITYSYSTWQIMETCKIRWNFLWTANSTQQEFKLL